jgi:hypothetical protein
VTAGWTTFDIAAAYGWSRSRASVTLTRWIDAGLVTTPGRDTVTGARLFDADEVRAARAADLAELADQGQVYRP